MRHKIWNKRIEREDKLEIVRRQYKIACDYCGWLCVIYPFEKKSKKICRNCGHYVYFDKKDLFKHRLREVMKNENIQNCKRRRNRKCRRNNCSINKTYR